MNGRGKLRRGLLGRPKSNPQGSSRAGRVQCPALVFTTSATCLLLTLQKKHELACLALLHLLNIPVSPLLPSLLFSTSFLQSISNIQPCLSSYKAQPLGWVPITTTQELQCPFLWSLQISLSWLSTPNAAANVNFPLHLRWTSLHLP